MTTIDLQSCMNEAYFPALYSQERFLVLYGGAGSGKSFFAAQKVVLRCMGESPHTFLCVRKVAATLRNSVYALLKGVIAQWGLSHLWAENKTDMSFTYLPNGNMILLSGLDDPEKIKSITGAMGMGISSIWIEEATELTPDDLNQLNLRLRGLLKWYKQIILSFNPINELHQLKKRFFDNEEPACRVVRTTYLDNRFIDEEYKAELEKLKDIDPALYKIYALGEWGTLKGVIYQNWIAGYLMDEPDEVIYGLDFGFNNPMALVRIKIKDRELWCEEVLYKRKITTENLVEEMRALGISDSDPIYCDAAEPDRIQQICDAGFNAYPAKKGQGSVVAGIIFCKALKIHVRPGDENIWNEQSSYKWREDKTGTVLDEPADFNNHAMDAIRYGAFTHLQDAGYTVSVL